MLWRASLLIGNWFIRGRGFEGSIWVLIGDALWILSSVEDFSHKEGGGWFKRNKCPVSPDTAIVPSETEPRGAAKRSFISPGWLFQLLLSNSRIMSFFWEKGIPAWYFCKKSQPKKWRGPEELRRKGYIISQRASTKGNEFRHRNLLRFIRDPHYLDHFSTPRQGLLYRSWVEHWECSSSGNKTPRDKREINSQSGELFFQAY